MLPDVDLFPLRGNFIRVHILQLLGGDEAHFRGQIGAQLGIADMEPVIGIADGADNGTDNQLEEIQIAVFPGDDFLPVPLIHIDGVDVIQRLIPADGVHIGIKAVAHSEMVALQGKALPLCQRMHHLSFCTHGGNIEADRPFVAIEVIVQAGILGNEQGGRHALEVQGRGKLILEGCLDIGDCALGVVSIQNGGIVFGNINFVHVGSPFRILQA